MTADLARSLRLTRMTVLAGLFLGGAALWLGWAQGAIAFGGFGGACLLQVAPALSLGSRIGGGLGNEGLERDRVTLRATAHLLRLLALAVAGFSLLALRGEWMPSADATTRGLALTALVLLGSLWVAKRGLGGLHPALELDAARSRVLLELAVLLATGTLLGLWVPWADALAALALAIRLFVAGQGLAKATTLRAACGGCGSGCGC
jgi:divalent metal cation (Fe/Co/Zn/Cd) transporter